MAVSGLPAALAREIEDDLGRFGVRHAAAADQVILTAEVRGVPVVLYLDETYPAIPPRLELSTEWSWRGGRRIRGLGSQERWNRTLGVGALLRELEQRFIDEPPTKRRRRRPRTGLLQRLRAFFAWIWNLLRRLFGRAPVRPPAAALSDAIRSRYRQILDEKSARVERYKQAIARLMTQGRKKTAAVETLGREIRRLEQAQEATLAEAERLVDAQKAAGRTMAEIKAGARYRRRLETWADRAADLDSARGRFAELEADAEAHLGKVRRHEAQLEALVRELDELEAEAAEVSADLATVELEEEIVDLRAGISRAASEDELRALMRQFRKAKAAVKITREAADLDATARDAEYLDVARRVSAAKRFESSVGLGEEPSRAGEEREPEGD